MRAAVRAAARAVAARAVAARAEGARAVEARAEGWWVVVATVTKVSLYDKSMRQQICMTKLRIFHHPRFTLHHTH